jgi:hypothetical protein
MSSNFLRLYRQINKDNRSSLKDHSDMTHENERREVLHKLGYSVGAKEPIKVERNWYHGKLAREKILKRQAGDTSDEPPVNYKEWRTDYSMKLIEINQLNMAAKEMRSAIRQRKRIPVTLWNKFENPAERELRLLGGGSPMRSLEQKPVLPKIGDTGQQKLPKDVEESNRADIQVSEQASQAISGDQLGPVRVPQKRTKKYRGSTLR